MKTKIQVGGSLREAARRAAKAWRRAEKGLKVAPQKTITFASWSALAAVMTEKRYELLRHLHSHPEPGIRPLSRALGRDYKRVYDDIKALTAVGLVQDNDGLLRADYDEIRTSIKVGDAA